MALDETAFDELAAGIFKRLLSAIDRVDPDLLEADGSSDMVTIAAASGEKVVVNTQRAARQLWVAGRGEGVHFTYDAAAGQWKDDRGRGLELLAFVARCVREASGVALEP